MNPPPPGVYLPTEEPAVYESTELANAGWYEQGQHGGALAALIGGHIDSVASLTKMQTSRLTLELFRVVPLVPLRIETSVIRDGKRIQVIEIRVLGNGEEMARANVQRLRLGDVGLPAGVDSGAGVLPDPDDIPRIDTDVWGHGPDGKVMFHRNAVEVREITGGFQIPGPGAMWMRLTTPIVAGRENTPLQRLLVTADFCNGVSRLSTDPGWIFMNPDLTVNVNRVPVDEWVGLQAESSYAPSGRGIATGTLWDRAGFLGRSTQTLYLDHIDD